MNRALAEEYLELLRAQGIEHLVRPATDPEEDRRLIARIRDGARQSAADYGETVPLPSDDDFVKTTGDRYADIADRIERAVTDLGGELPGPVYVGRYPHQSLNAQALAGRNGTLLLINTGLHFLLVEVGLALTTRMLTWTRNESGGMEIQKTTPAMERRRQDADDNLVNSLAAYILHTDLRRGGRQQIDGTGRGAMSFLCAEAAEDFAVAHEYGHFLAGHLTGPARRRGDGDWLRKSRDQEFEADEIGMLLVLKTREHEDLIQKSITVAGTFLFFAVDHLLNRVRDEVPEIARTRIVSDHPPSDARAATLRRTLTEIEGPNVFQLADGIIPILSSHEDRIIASLRKLLATTRSA